MADLNLYKKKATKKPRVPKVLTQQEASCIIQRSWKRHIVSYVTDIVF